MDRQEPMSDERRRAICRTSFLCCCVIPTLMVFYFILHPFSQQDWEQFLEAQLGLDVEIESVERTGPWNTILRGVVLRGDTENESVAATEVRIMHGSRIEISVPQPVQLPVEMATCLGIVTGEKIIHKGQLAKNALVHFRQLELVENRTRRTKVFRNVQWVFGPYKEGVGSRLTAEMAPTLGLPGGKLSVFCERGKSKTGITYDLHTNNNEVEGWVLSNLIAGAPTFVEDARFSGRIIVENSQEQNEAKIRGYLVGLDLTRLDRSKNLTGQALFRIEDCSVRNGKIHSLAASASCENGSISPQFANFLVHDLGLQQSPLSDESQPSASDLSYRELDFQIALNNGMLRLKQFENSEYLARDIRNRPVFAWGGLEPELHLGHYLLDESLGIAQKSGNQAVEVLSLFDLPSPLPVRVANQNELGKNRF